MNGAAQSCPPEGVTFAPAGASQTAAVMAVLPELLGAKVWPRRLLVAHPNDDASCLLGAAAFEPVVVDDRWPGFRCMTRVLDGFRRRGIGRALMAQLADDARQWQVPYLHSWSHVQEGESAKFLRACGFIPAQIMYHFIGEVRSSLPVTSRLADGLIRHGRVPASARLCPLADVPVDAVAMLQCSQFGGAVAPVRQLITEQLRQPLAAALSFGLWDGDILAGFLLASDGPEMPAVKYWATDPTFRHGWPAVLLLNQFIVKLGELGIPAARYSCNDRTTATLNIARKTGAREEAVTHRFVADLHTTLEPLA